MLCKMQLSAECRLWVRFFLPPFLFFNAVALVFLKKHPLSLEATVNKIPFLQGRKKDTAVLTSGLELLKKSCCPL